MSSSGDYSVDEAFDEAAGLAQSGVKSCPTCTLLDKLTWRQHIVASWLLFLSCERCNVSWAICRECHRCSVRFHSRDCIMRHSRAKHLKQHEATKQSSLDFEGTSLPVSGIADNNDIIEQDDSGNNDDVNGSDTAIDVELDFESLALNDRSKRYFECDTKGQGVNFLVALSQMKVSHCELDHYHDYEVHYHMDVAHLVSQLPMSLVRLLSSILSQTVRIVEKRCDARRETTGLNECGASGNKLLTTLPCTIQYMRSLYLDNKYGIIRSLPRPNVRLIKNHGYVSLRECVADLLAHGAPLDVITSHTISSSNKVVRKMSESARAKRIYENARNVYGSMMDDIDVIILVLYFNEWSDGFEPLSASKSNRGSTWAKTLTLCPPLDCIHKLSHTYTVAVARSRDNHEIVESMLSEEMRQLRGKEGNLFYSKRHGRFVHVYLELFASLQDQPERRSANYIMLGGGKYTAQWGRAADFASIALGVPSCTECMRRLFSWSIISSSEVPHSCRNCVSWDIEAESGILDFDPPQHFPVSEISQSNQKLRPSRINYNTLKQAVEKTHDNIVSGAWTIDNGNAFLWVHGINKEARTEILQCASNERKYKTIFEERHCREEEFTSISRLKDNDPHLFTRWQFPALWSRGTEMSQHVDVIMHLLFLGVIKATIKRIEDWLKSKCKYEGFVKFVRGRLESVQYLRLGWCKVLPYTSGNFGGWVSENYLALARLLPWFYSALPFAENGVRLPYVEPTGPPKRWTVKQNKYWLSSRKLSINGLAKDLRERVALLMSQDGGPPEPVIDDVATGTVTDVTEVARSLWCMVCNLMIKEVVIDRDVRVARHQIKLFLNVYHIFDSHIPKKSKKKRKESQPPTWVSSYNFVCLLNLPDMMGHYGPLTNLWEGGGQGEKVLTKLKPLHNGYRPGWQKHLLTNALDAMAFDRVMKSKNTIDADDAPFSSCLNESANERNADYSDYKRYKDTKEIRTAFRRGRPMSVIVISGSKDVFWAVVSRSNEMIPITLHLPSNTNIHRISLGLPYYAMKMQESPFMVRVLVSEDVISQYCIMLPIIEEVAGCTPGGDGDIRNYFAIINSKWEAFNCGEFKRPNFPV